MIFSVRKITKLLLFLALFSCTTNSDKSAVKSSQKVHSKPILSIKNRSTNALNGSGIVKSINELSQNEREAYLFGELYQGNVPNYLRKLSTIKTNHLINGKKYELVYYVSPDYFLLGSSSNYFTCPTTPLLAQKIANTVDAVLPTKKMVDQIYMASPIKLEPQPIPPSKEMTTVPVFNDHHILLQKQKAIKLDGFPIESLTSGHKKDIIISNSIYTKDGSKVVIYGWHTSPNKPIQPVYNGHANTYVDYSHGFRLVHKIAYVNGKAMLISDILKSEILHVLLSDEGPIHKPYYPTY